ncbi:helix-turn-helix domain-containing protein [Roseovarius salinarum]|uniref:helix-turn-helix domain-containing protein n=1 Tax=Roseovarius salinarum TaxID=1981892 RepID=UPI000C3240B1|nr:LysR family transcriptional regulator [Roseovarius salinarum]
MTKAFEIDALHTLVAGTEAGSFARAAVQLGRSHSAVSMRLKKLEQQANTPLFLRKGRGPSELPSRPRRCGSTGRRFHAWNCGCSARRTTLCRCGT